MIKCPSVLGITFGAGKLCIFCVRVSGGKWFIYPSINIHMRFAIGFSIRERNMKGGREGGEGKREKKAVKERGTRREGGGGGVGRGTGRTGRGSWRDPSPHSLPLLDH